MATPSHRLLRFGRLLFVSVLLNIALLFYLLGRDLPSVEVRSTRSGGRAESSFAESARRLRTLSQEDLIALLSNRQIVESGYRLRDLALATLVAERDFDLARALGQPLSRIQQRSIRVEGRGLILFPELSNDHFIKILDFAARERWPLTARGLLRAAGSSPLPIPPSLEAALISTPFFKEFEERFRDNRTLTRSELALLLCEWQWEAIEEFRKENGSWQSILLAAAVGGSARAAKLLLRDDFAFALKKNSDEEASLLLELLPPSDLNCQRYALLLLAAPRGASLWKKAAETLYRSIGEPLPDPLSRQETIRTFAPLLSRPSSANPIK